MGFKGIKYRFLIISLFGLSACATFPDYKIELNPSNSICANEVYKLNNIKIKPDNPEFGFVYNQTCIALRACQNREKMQDSIWIDKIITHFVDAFIEKSGNWEIIESKCQSSMKLNPLRNLLCQRRMAKYHIFHDLPKSLNYAGCGTNDDWKTMENLIISCLNQANYPPIISQYTKNRIITYRDKIRNQCLKQ